MPKASLSMLLYLCSALVRLLLANTIGLRMVLSEVITITHTRDHTGTIQHMNTQHHIKNQTIIKENVK